MIAFQFFQISTFLSFIFHVKCENENNWENTKLSSTRTNPLLNYQEKYPLNNNGRRLIDDQINLGNLGINLLQSDTDSDFYNGNSNINSNSNLHSKFPWNRATNRFHKKPRDGVASRKLQDMQQKQWQQIFQIMMPEGSRTKDNFGLMQLNNQLPLDNINFRRYNEIKKSPTKFDRHYSEIKDDKLACTKYHKNIYSRFQQRIKNIKKLLEHIENEFQCYDR